MHLRPFTLLLAGCLAACPSPVTPPDAESLCASLKTASLDDCADITSSCFSVRCVPTTRNGQNCPLAESFPEALVSPAVLADEADVCETYEGARWQEWDCGTTGAYLVACEATE